MWADGQTAVRNVIALSALAEGYCPAHMDLLTDMRALVLKTLTADVSDAYYTLIDLNRLHLTSHGDYPELGAATVESTARDLVENTDGALRFGIWLEDQLIGRVDLVPKEPGHFVLGYWLGQASTGHGYATSACSTAIEYVRGEGATHIWAGVTKGNTASEQVLVRLGFEHVADMETYDRFCLELV